jgi:hypothetical protein
MNVVVDGSPESCLAQVEAFFAHDWPHGGSYRRPTPNTLTLAARAPRHRYMLESRSGVVLWLILTLITVGAFAAIWFFYWMIREAGSSDPEIYKARVVATPESPTQTRLSVSASREDWRQTLESWVQQELVENSVAKKASRGQPDASDIPGQISRLAELRDGGVITAEEFEEKKRDLLDRM